LISVSVELDLDRVMRRKGAAPSCVPRILRGLSQSRQGTHREISTEPEYSRSGAAAQRREEEIPLKAFDRIYRINRISEFDLSGTGYLLHPAILLILFILSSCPGFSSTDARCVPL
jgi:hypothetical protein